MQWGVITRLFAMFLSSYCRQGGPPHSSWGQGGQTSARLSGSSAGCTLQASLLVNCLNSASTSGGPSEVLVPELPMPESGYPLNHKLVVPLRPAPTLAFTTLLHTTLPPFCCPSPEPLSSSSSPQESQTGTKSQLTSSEHVYSLAIQRYEWYPPHIVQADTC